MLTKPGASKKTKQLELSYTTTEVQNDTELVFCGEQRA